MRKFERYLIRAVCIVLFAAYAATLVLCIISGAYVTAALSPVILFLACGFAAGFRYSEIYALFKEVFHEI